MEDVIKKVYGPYVHRKTGRRHVIIIYLDGHRRTVQFSRYLMEKHLNRRLDPILETVDHVNGDFTDDRLSNLRLVPFGKHQSEDHTRVKLVEIVCVWCGRSVKKKPRNLDGNAKKKRAGPFCSQSCAGKYSRNVQLGRINKFLPQPRMEKEKREYYKINKAK